MIAYSATEWLYQTCFARMVDIEFEGGLASFTFDDFPRSALDEGGAILENRGWRGTYYVAAGLMDLKNGDPAMCGRDDVVRCGARGHEVAHHTYGHVKCPETATRDLKKDFGRNFEALGAIASRNFAYPFGARDFRSQRVSGSVFDSCRGNNAGINGKQTNLSALKAVALYEHRSADEALRLVGEARRTGGWVIFYTHDVGPNPSRFGCTPAYLDRVASAVVAAGLRVGTVRECLGWIGR